jgi:hypothetical protein
MAYKSFEQLDVWKRACLATVRIYDTMRDSRDFALRDQMQRAAVSIASNIAEGAERGGAAGTLPGSCESRAARPQNFARSATSPRKWAFYLPIKLEGSSRNSRKLPRCLRASQNH